MLRVVSIRFRQFVIPEVVQALIVNTQRSKALEQEKKLELSQFAPVGGEWIFIKGLESPFFAES
jgi:hypothetical protein